MKKYKVTTIIIVLLIILGVFIYFLISNNKIDESDVIDKPIVTEIEVISTYDNPKVPDDFKKIETSNASWEPDENEKPKGWNNGLVIEDENGNQFVWVPITSVNEYNDIYYINYNTKTMFTPSEGEPEEINQIQRYGGIYISRYEAGLPITMQDIRDNISTETNNINGIPISKQNTIPWNYISTEQATKNSKSMYSKSDLYSDIITYRQWLYINFWFSNSGYDVKNPKSYGNYSNTIFRFTGFYSKDSGKSYEYGDNKIKSEYNIIVSTGTISKNVNNNIYDFYGNLSECTKGGKALGGFFDNSSIADLFTNSWPNYKTGFRIVLYQV